MIMDPTPCISVRNVSMRFGAQQVLENASMDVGCGERVVITGENGAGKTTMLKLVLGLLRPDQGGISVLGRRVGSRQWLRQRVHVAYLNQEAVSVDFPISASEVVEIGVSAARLDRRARQRRVLDAMERTGCRHVARKEYSILSGGEKQRVSLARCLCQQPKILLLDEPHASLDPAARTDLIDMLGLLNEEDGITIVMVSHDADRVDSRVWRNCRLASGAFVP